MCALLLGSCADGYESPDGIDHDVRNARMQTPSQDDITFKVSTDGTYATISWPTVSGAGGHEVTFKNVDDPENPVVIDGYDNYILDGSTMTVSVEEDSKYELTIRTLGNAELGNTDDPEPKTYAYSTGVPSVATIPSGSDISTFWNALELETGDTEVAIDLEAGGEYTLTELVDFSSHNITLRGDKVHRPMVKISGNGCFSTYSGLKFKFINFDMTDATQESFLYMSNTDLPESIQAKNMPDKYVGSKVQGNVYIVENPIYIAHCWFKNVPQSIIHDNKVVCAFWYFTLYDCIVQLHPRANTTRGFISFEQAGRSIKNITIENSTIYNTNPDMSKSTYFIRYQNSSNSQPHKVYGELNAEYRSHTMKFMHSTMVNAYHPNTSKWFMNNVANNDFFITVDHMVFYNCDYLYRLSQGSRTFRFNFWYNDNSGQHRDVETKDSSNMPFASEYDPQFTGDTMQELDFSLPNGGLNFTPQEYMIVSNEGGDPRWLPEK